MPTTTQARTRGDFASVTSVCTDGDRHRVRFTREEVIESVHDPAADAVLAALGGQAHPCQRAVNAFTAARALRDAWTGVQDIPEASFRRSGWSHPHRCESSRCSYPTLAHLTSPGHVAGFFDADVHTVSVLARWLMRAHEDATCAPVSLGLVAGSQVLDRFEGFDLGDARAQSRLPRSIYDLVVSPAFAEVARPLLGADLPTIVQVRAGGVRVEWLREVAQRVPARAARTAREANPNLGSALAKARNVPARTVADFLRAGIVSHFHTYHRFQVTPAQVLQVWHGSNQQRTLAQLLKDGWSVPQALQEFPRAG